MAEETAPKKNVYISLHKAFIHENIKYTDKEGKEKTFNVVRLPSDTVIDGKDAGGYEFSPLREPLKVPGRELARHPASGRPRHPPPEDGARR